MRKREDSPGSATPVRYVKGVGESRAALLERLGVRTVGDLLLTLPRRYEDRRAFMRMTEVQPGETATVAGEVVTTGWVRSRYGKDFFEAAVRDETSVVMCRWFGARYLRDQLKKGDRLVVHGKVGGSRARPVFQHPEFERVGPAGEASLHADRIVPIYPLTEELTQRTMRRIMFHAVENFAGTTEEVLPPALLARRGLPPVADAVRQVHFPDSLEEAKLARYRLVFEEFLCIQVILAVRKAQSEHLTRGFAQTAAGKLRGQLLASLPFDLTAAQERVLEEIRGDMRKPFPMHRLLQGDVGSGKTVVAACALLDAVECGRQGSVMAPTEVLTRQHARTLTAYLEPLGIRPAVLTGDVQGRARRDLLEAIAAGDVPVVIGTHAVIQEGVRFHRLGLAVIDEQHKFGVEQRGLLYAKGDHPDVLVMTATPIPRTLAMTVYGDLDVSVLDEMPAGRPETVTRVIRAEQRHDAYAFIRRQAKKGRQAFIIYPLVAESEDSDLPAAVAMHRTLSEETFPCLKVGLVHGRLPTEEKDAVMRDFAMGRVSILVATTVVEVGIDVPNATVMMVEHAERFGLAQLHQLRGRIGRGKHKSFCILQGDPHTLDAWRRLKIMETTSDGFCIAEEDLRIRGMGNLLGREQSGLPDLRVGNPVTDVAILQDAREEAFSLVADDVHLADAQYAGLKRRARGLYRRAGGFARIA